jgi:MYXO-CTERM domain-containing protein
MSLRRLALAALLTVPSLAFATEADVLRAGLEASHVRSLVFERQGGSLLAHGFRAGPYAGDAQQVAQAFLTEHRALLGIEPDELAFVASLPAHGARILRLQRQHQGLPVAGAYASLRLGDDGRVSMLRSHDPGELSLDTRPGIDAAAAAALALEAAALPGVIDGEPAPVLEILPRGGHALLVWRVALSCDAPLRSVLVTVDAHSGAVLGVTDRRREASGWAWDQSPLDGDTIEVELMDLSGDQDAMTGSQVRVESVAFEGGSQITTQLALPDDAGDFFYEPDEDAADEPFAEVHTYHHLSTLRRFFADSLGHEFDGQLQAYVNYREDEGGTYDNAYFSQDMYGNDMLVFGQGSVGDFSYDTDIVAHEHGHAIIEARTAFPQDFIVYDDYGWNNAIGGIHEGVADFWAGSYQGDSMVGEYIPVRDMDNDATCPEDLSGESHDDGEIVGGAAWAMSQVIGMEAAEVVVYDALGMLSSSPTYAELAEMMIAVAYELVDAGEIEAAAVEQVEAVMDERGMLRCGRAFDLEVGEVSIFQVNLIMGLTELPESMCDMAHEQGFALTMPFQLALTTPPASEGELERIVLAFVMSSLYGGSVDRDALDYSLYLRKGELVTFEMESVSTGMGFNLDVPHAQDYDLAFEGNPTAIVLDSSNIEIESDTTYYLAMRHMNCVAVDMGVGSELAMVEQIEDTGDGGGEEPKACGCSARPSGAPAALLVGLLGLLGLARRRREG